MHHKPINISIFLLLISLFALTACIAETADESLDPIAAIGKKIFKMHCASCHVTVGDTVIVGPSLAGIAVRAATQEEGLDAKLYLITSIIKPDAYVVEGFDSLMPTNYGVKLTGEELDELIVYLFTLK